MTYMLCNFQLLQGDGRPFWKLVVSEATGCDDERYFEEVYEVISPEAENCSWLFGGLKDEAFNLMCLAIFAFSIMQMVMLGIFLMGPRRHYYT